MNKRLLILPLLALCGRAVAQSDVTVNLKGAEVDSIRVYISEETFDNEKPRFTVAAKGGKAKFHINETTARSAFIEAVPGEQRVFFTHIPGTKIKVTGTWNAHKVSGHQFYKDEEQYDALTKENMKGFEEFEAKTKAMRERGEELNEDIYNELSRLSNEHQSISEQFIDSHKNSDYSVYLAMTNWRPEDRDKQLDKLTPEVRNGFMKSYVDAIKAREKAIMEQRERQKKEREEKMAKMQGTDAPEFALPSLDGTPLSISSLKGKVTVIDFWGKWCYWCMKGMPDMKKYYEKYAGKLEILGVNYGDTEEVWKKTVEENELTWKHVRMDRTNKEQTAILQQYGVSGFPTKVILSAEGKIIKVVVGEDPAFYTFIDELLGE